MGCHVVASQNLSQWNALVNKWNTLTNASKWRALIWKRTMWTLQIGLQRGQTCFLSAWWPAQKAGSVWIWTSWMTLELWLIRCWVVRYIVGTLKLVPIFKCAMGIG